MSRLSRAREKLRRMESEPVGLKVVELDVVAAKSKR
jgi:hypothetical protein